jgi:hypothetical protein
MDIKEINGNVSNYAAYHDGPLEPGQYYYRLKMEETNGNVVYSDVRTARLHSTGAKLLVFPNPEGVLKAN